MSKLILTLLRSATAYSVFVFLLSCNSLWADDIDVYGLGGTGPGAKLPNVLFVFDTSSSMNRQVDGEETTDSGSQSKLDILHDAIKDMLDLSDGRINVGVTSYNSSSQGIKWPVSNLQQDAHEFDADIPAGFSVKDTINSIIQHDPSGGFTATVDALYEATRYFRGEPVWISGTSKANDHRPHSWQEIQQTYNGGSHIAAHPATYSPSNAHETGAQTVSGSLVSCYDYTVGGTIAGETNSCASKTVESCNSPEPETLSWDPNYCSSSNSTYQWSCTKWDTTGSECLSGSGSCSIPGGYTGHKAYQKCYYQGDDYLTDKWNGASYQSPIGQSCGSNFVVLLSDGAPSRNSARSSVQSLTGADCEPLSQSIFQETDGSYYYGDCGPELAEFVHTTDQLADVPDSTMTVYTIGFGLGGPGGASAQNYLRMLAEKGGGEFLVADQADALSAAFSKIVNKISSANETGSGISVGIDRRTASHSDRAYINLYEPSRRRSWRGNTKGYYLNDTGLLDVDRALATEVTDEGTRFKDTARSFWSANADGNSVSMGGASEQMEAGSRKLYTYTGVVAPDNVALAIPEHQLVAANTALTIDMIDPALDAGERTELLDWLQSAPMADPLHTVPRVLTYDGRRVLFTMTNQGLLHAIDVSAPSAVGDASGGEELFGFMPQALLSNLAELKQNAYTGAHIYGLDGALSVWHNDADNDGIVNGGERVVLFFGMRRGGQQYFALDVSSIDSPRLLWRIDPSQTGFEALGQSWSRPSLITVKWSGSERKVLVFGGGYDIAADTQNKREAHASGHMIYMIDPLTGQLLWSAGKDSLHDPVGAMQYAIPSDIRIIDADANGIADRLYVGDLGGQVWRVKLDEASFGPWGGTDIHRIADLADDSEAGHRRFFYAPTIYYHKRRDTSYFGIALGSGNRADPLDDTAENRIYLLRDDDTPDTETPSTLSVKSHSDLYDATSNALQNGVYSADDKTTLDESDGWYIQLAQGEKSLSSLVAFQRELIFTTYTPNFSSATSLSCDVAGALKRVYFVNQNDATPQRKEENTSDDTSDVVSYIESSGIGIPGEPVIVFPPTGDSVDVYVDKEKVREIGLSLDVMYWYPRK